MQSTTTPDFTSWFAGPWRAMLSVVAWLSIPILFFGVGTAALRGDLTSVLRRGLGAPVLMALGHRRGLAGYRRASSRLVNGCCGLLVDVAIGGNQGFGQGLAHLSDFALSATVASGGSGLPGLAAALIVALAGLAALVIWFVLALAGSASLPGGARHPLGAVRPLLGRDGPLDQEAGRPDHRHDPVPAGHHHADGPRRRRPEQGQLSVSGSASTDMTTLFLAVAFLILGSLALPMALKHVPAATEHAAAAASQISGPGRMTYMGSRIAGTARMMGRSGGGQQAIVRQAGAAAGPVGVAASAGVGAATPRLEPVLDGAGGAANAGRRRTDERPSGQPVTGPGFGAGAPGPSERRRSAGPGRRCRPGRRPPAPVHERVFEHGRRRPATGHPGRGRAVGHRSQVAQGVPP